MRDSFVFYKSFYESIRKLSDDIQIQIFRAIVEYALYENEEVELNVISESLFALIKPQLNANINRYENGKRGGRPKGENNQNETESKPNNNQTITKAKPKHNQNETKTKPNHNQSETKAKPNVNVNVNDNDNVNDINMFTEQVDEQAFEQNEQEIEHVHEKEDWEVEFEEFWKIYPRKQSKQNAIKLYKKLYATSRNGDILAGLKRQIPYFPKDLQYVPMPSTWLNQRRWEDEIQMKSNVSNCSSISKNQKILCIDPETGKQIEI